MDVYIRKTAEGGNKASRDNDVLPDVGYDVGEAKNTTVRLKPCSEKNNKGLLTFDVRIYTVSVISWLALAKLWLAANPMVNSPIITTVTTIVAATDMRHHGQEKDAGPD
eukprot:5419487-Pyramimonas_sp.AAC.3